jgi:hypothetical protein
MAYHTRLKPNPSQPLKNMSFDPILPHHLIYQASHASYLTETSIYQSGPLYQFLNQTNHSWRINLEVISNPQALGAPDYHARILTLANLIDSLSSRWWFSLSLDLPTLVTSSRQTTKKKLFSSSWAKP